MRHAGCNTLRLKEDMNINDISSQEIHRLRVVVLDRLRNINKHHLAIADEEVELREITMNEAAILEHFSHSDTDLVVTFFEGGGRKTDILQAGRGPPFRTKELHGKNVLTKKEDTRARNTSVAQAIQVSTLLLSPSTHHLSGVALAVSLEAVFTRDVLFTILEDENGGLVDFEGDEGAWFEGVVTDIEFIVIIILLLFGSCSGNEFWSVIVFILFLLLLIFRLVAAVILLFVRSVLLGMEVILFCLLFLRQGNGG